MNKLFSGDELEQIKAIPTELNVQFNRPTNDDDDLTDDEWQEYQFDQYAREYHSLDPSEQHAFMYANDFTSMMNY